MSTRHFVTDSGLNIRHCTEWCYRQRTTDMYNYSVGLL